MGGGKILSKLIHKFESDDKRVIAVDKENGGVSSARNKGIDIARGEWIVFVDPDDRLAPYYLQSLYESVVNSSSVLGIGGFNQLYAKTGTKKDYSLDIEGADIPIAEAYEHFPSLNVPWNKIYKREYLIKTGIRFPEGITYLEDEHFCLKLYSMIDTCCMVRNCGYTYMMNDCNSALSKYHKNLKENMALSTKLRNKLLVKFGKTKEVLEHLAIENISISLYILIINIFKIGTELSFTQQVHYIKWEIMGDTYYMDLFEKHNQRNDKMVVKVCNGLLKTKSPLLVAVVFKILFWIKYNLRN